MPETLYGKTKEGQLLYDLAFTDLGERYLAQKHGLSIVTIRTMRASKAIQKLRAKVKADQKSERRKKARTR